MAAICLPNGKCMFKKIKRCKIMNRKSICTALSTVQSKVGLALLSSQRIQDAQCHPLSWNKDNKFWSGGVVLPMISQHYSITSSCPELREYACKLFCSSKFLSWPYMGFHKEQLGKLTKPQSGTSNVALDIHARCNAAAYIHNRILRFIRKNCWVVFFGPWSSRLVFCMEKRVDRFIRFSPVSPTFFCLE
jgi:hypothetical protein